MESCLLQPLHVYQNLRPGRKVTPDLAFSFLLKETTGLSPHPEQGASPSQISRPHYRQQRQQASFKIKILLITLHLCYIK